MTKSSVDRKRSRYGEEYSLRFHKQLKIYHLSCNNEIPSLIAKFVETDGDLAMDLFERLESNYKAIGQLKNENQKLDEKICLLTRDLIKTKSYEQLEKELNRIKNENKQLKHNNKMLSMKMSEVYTNYRLLKEFSEDTNPNDAVKKVLSELMQITKEYR